MGFLSKLFGSGSRGSLSSLGRPYQLVARAPVAKSTLRLTFALESPDAVLGLPVGHHLLVKLPGADGISRAYTPVTGNETKGSFDLVVKVYPQGIVSQYLDSVKVGDSVEISGPQGEITYRGGGAFEIENPFAGSKRIVSCTSLGMVAGGTGITPMYQIASHSASLAGDQLQMSLLFANRSPEDVMLRSEIDVLAASCQRFRAACSVDEIPDGAEGCEGLWKGHVSTSMLRDAMERLPAMPELVAICGPAGFHKAVKGMLMEGMAYNKDSIFEF